MRHNTMILSLAAVVAIFVAQSSMGSAFHSERGCSSCHVPHNATGDGGASINEQVPLWNPEHSTTSLAGNYVNTNNSLNASIGSVNGASKLCLSCHDGSYSHVSAGHSFGPGSEMGGLSSSHPISFVYDQALAAADEELVDPETLADDVLDGLSQMQCTSCHDIHSSAVVNAAGQELDEDTGEMVDTQHPYLRWNYGNRNLADPGEFCRNCHIK